MADGMELRDAEARLDALCAEMEAIAEQERVKREELASLRAAYRSKLEEARILSDEVQRVRVQRMSGYVEPADVEEDRASGVGGNVGGGNERDVGGVGGRLAGGDAEMEELK